MDAREHRRPQVAADEAQGRVRVDRGHHRHAAPFRAHEETPRRYRARCGRRCREGCHRRSKDQEGAGRSEALMPIRPMLATLSKSVVSGPLWVFEEKYDGIRAVAEKKGARVRLWSRTGQDLTGGFAEIVDAVRALPDDDLVLDGELVVFDRAGVSRFQLLQRRGVDPRTRPVYVVFDVLRSKGRDLTRSSLVARRARLLALVSRRAGPLMPSRQLRAAGEAALEVARAKGWEGVIAKLRDAPYEAGARSSAWRKLKVRGESEFVIGGYTPPEGSRAEFGALLVGMVDGPHLRYTGKVGTGFTH